jgi:predicted transcriptional regulator
VWWDRYFLDLWERTDRVQRACLVALNKRGACDVLMLQQETKLDEAMISHAIDALLRRDVIRREGEGYCIAAPLLYEWIERLKKEHYDEMIL